MRRALSLPKFLKPIVGAHFGNSPIKRSFGAAFKQVGSNTKGINAACCNESAEGLSRTNASALKYSTTAEPLFENPLVGASITGSVNEAVEVHWKNGEVTHYPYLWLRDNCYCPKCKKQGRDVFQRDFLLRDLNPNATPQEIQTTEDGEVVITWEDGHISPYSHDWLKEYGFTSIKQNERETNLSLPLVLWNHETMQDKIPSVKFDDLLNDDHSLYFWLKTLEQTGVCLLTDIPCEAGQVRRIGQRVAFLKKTNYGETFAVKSKVDPSNLAYTTLGLGLHTDLPYYSHPPGMQMLHCIAQVKTKGGENQLADAFYVAKKMEREYPDYYKTLSTEPIDFVDVGTDYYTFYKMSRHTIFSFQTNGEIKQVIHNSQARGVKLTMPVEKVQDFYKALKKFDDLLYSDECHINYKLKPGECICFHNNRVLHGRTAYEVMEPGERELEGGYIDWDELRSKRRVLQEGLGLPLI